MSTELHIAQNIGTSCERSPEYQALLGGGVGWGWWRREIRAPLRHLGFFKV